MPTQDHLTGITGNRLQIRFDPNQEHQLDAVRSVVDLFNGMEHKGSRFELVGDEAVPNLPELETLDRYWLLGNLQTVQERNGLAPSPAVVVDSSLEVDGIKSATSDSWDYPSFTIEMETGTGKTYVYLRTVLELRRTYGFRKFVVVVPSVAIYEGVAKTFAITRTHFASVFGNEPVHLIRYESEQLSRLREFASSSACEILLITLDSFNKATNVIYRASERLPGERRPYEYIQATRPILILDEPQNMGSAIARAALATLHPLLALRYSATHRESPNLIYRLTPFEAFRRNLVKRIQVSGVTEREDANRPLLALATISTTGPIVAKVRAQVMRAGRVLDSEVTLRNGTDLYEQTGVDAHRNGYVVAEIHRGEKWLRFENGLKLRHGETLGPSRPELFKAQIEETIRFHMTAQERLHEKGIKVLSLFFIDRVANYTDDDGLIKTLFDRAFRRIRRDYAFFDRIEPHEVRSAYFASKKQGPAGDERYIDLSLDEERQKKEEREAAKRAFELIMKDKERLLSFDEKVCFIFAHSALKEGWDNPNVFQICTLNQTVSEVRKRQEIGRGLRLCVNQNGERVMGDEINVLTVIANQSYQSYAEQLQDEYRQEGQEQEAPPKVTKATLAGVPRNNGVYGSREFGDFWSRLSQRIRYEILVDTPELVRQCASRLNNAAYPQPKVVIQRGDYVMYRYMLELQEVVGVRARIRMRMENTLDERRDDSRLCKAGDDLSRTYADDRLRGFIVARVAETPVRSVVFENKEVLTMDGPREYSSAMGQRIKEAVTIQPTVYHPVFDLIGRAQRETTLTRASLIGIYRGLTRRVAEKVFTDPEGFAGIFISTIRDELANHIAERLAFRVDGESAIDLEELFPDPKRYAQRELIDAGARGVYERVQKDSEVEEKFVERLRADDKVVLFFKFPAAYKVRLPGLVGNYNPDWGVIRRADDGGLTLHLVRETKGTEDISRLRFPHEKRKIVGAMKYFATAGIDYRVVSEKTADWWKDVESVDKQLDLAEK